MRNGDVEKVSRETDPIKRNRVISATYAADYLKAPHLGWFGTAAFASKQVGCGMQSAKGVEDGWFVRRFSENQALADHTLARLGDGNKAVFEELQPVYNFYAANGMDGLKRCGPERQPPVPDGVMNGFEQADRARATNDPDLARQGTLSMLRHEQFVTLQKSAYDDPLFRRALEINQKWNDRPVPTFGQTQPTKVVFDSACAAADAPAIEMAGGNLGDKPWRWGFAAATAEKFDELSRSQSSTINAALGKIASDGGL
ncbi:DUF2515 family protein [Sphingomonas sp.]|uniref:DUF2515 family protein n=1 Tax=Sphingomonas sp. TaxID=28214 RepID=UPI003AFFC51E